MHKLQIEALASNFLQLILLPTEQCNFRCTYCYETFDHKQMTPDVIAGIKALIDRRIHSLDRLDVDWFGGEPLVAFDVVRDIAGHAQSAARAAGVFYRSGMTTNGYRLTPAVLAECVRLGIRNFQISLDGTAETHNETRRLASGAGTFDRIWANLEAARDGAEDYEILLRLHFTENSWEQAAELGARLAAEFGDDSRFGFFFRPIGNFGGPGATTVTPVSRTRRGEIEDELWRRSGLSRRAAPEGESLCYAGKANSLVVRSTGALAKCTVAFADDHNSIGRLTKTGDLEVDQTKFQRWIAPVIEERWEHISCPLGFVAREVAAERITVASV